MNVSQFLCISLYLIVYWTKLRGVMKRCKACCKLYNPHSEENEQYMLDSFDYVVGLGHINYFQEN